MERPTDYREDRELWKFIKPLVMPSPLDMEQRRKELDESRLVGMPADQLKAVMYQRMAIAGRRMDEKIAKAKAACAADKELESQRANLLKFTAEFLDKRMADHKAWQDRELAMLVNQLRHSVLATIRWEQIRKHTTQELKARNVE